MVEFIDETNSNLRQAGRVHRNKYQCSTREPLYEEGTFCVNGVAGQRLYSPPYAGFQPELVCHDECSEISEIFHDVDVDAVFRPELVRHGDECVEIWDRFNDVDLDEL